MRRQNINLSINTKINNLDQDINQKSPYTSVPTNRKSFIRTMSTIKNDAYSKLLQSHHELDKVVESMNEKMQKVLQKQQIAFLTAYRNQMKLIRQNLKQLRNKNINEEIFGVSQQKIKTLQKQLALFRDQSFILFQKVQTKDKQLEILRLRCQEAQSQKNHLQNQFKKLMKIIKTKQTFEKSSTQKLPHQHYDKQTNPISRTRCHSPLLSNKLNHFITENLTNPLFEKLKTIITKEQQLNAAWKLILQNSLENQKKYLQLKHRHKTMLKQNSFRTSREQLESFFLDCIETVRKDIFRKSNNKKSNITYRQQLIDFSQFRKQNKICILETFIKNESVIRLIYNALFPRKNNKITIQPEPQLISL